MDQPWKKRGVCVLCCALFMITSAFAYRPALSASEDIAAGDDAAATSQAANDPTLRRVHSHKAPSFLDPSRYEGMSPEEAKKAMLADAKKALDAKVADGSLTREKADEILARLESKPFPPERGSRMGEAPTRTDLSRYEGMSPEEAKKAMLADAKKALDAKVADGSLTREKADEILARLESKPFPPERGTRTGQASPDPSRNEGKSPKEAG